MSANIVKVSIENTVPVLEVDVTNTAQVVEVNLETPVIQAKIETTPVIEVTMSQRGPAGADSTVPGPKGDTGDVGPKGDKGDTGDAFTYSMFTPEQLVALTGPQGPKGDKGDTGEHGDKGDTGAAFVYSMFTAEQLLALKGDKGDTGETGAKGDKGDTGEAGAAGTNGSSIVWQGPWNPSGSYVSDQDVVSSNGGSYIKISGSGNSGSPPYADPVRWAPVAVKGDTGAKGDTGETGAKGDTGETGAKGDKGDTGGAATITVGTVSTEAAGSPATVTNVGTTSAAIFNFAIPQGAKGDKGDTGTSVTIIGSVMDVHIINDPQATLNAAFPSAVLGNGVIAQDDGHLWVYEGSMWLDVGEIRGPQGTPGTNGLSAYEIAQFNGFTGTELEWLSSLVGAKGDKGDTGDTGLKGDTGDTGAAGTNGTNGLSAYEIAVQDGFVGTEAQWLASLIGPKGDTGTAGTNGTNGVGVPTGGTTGQVLAKIDGVDYNTQWITLSAGGGGSGTVTSIATSGNVNGITLTGGTITTSGTITLGGTLGSIANSQLSNSTISGVALGSNLFDLTISSPLSGTSYNGSSAATIALATAYGDTQNPYASKTANYVLAAPNGSAGAPTFRALVASDIPTLNQNTTGSAGSVANALTAGTGISFSSGTTYNGSAAITINNAGVTSITTSSGLSTNTSATGAVSITNTGVTSVTAGTGISISASTGGVTISASGSPTFTNVTVTGQIIEPFNTYSTTISGSPSITFNCSTGNIWRVTSTASSNWTALFTNVQITTGQATNITMIVTQGATPYLPTAISINGTSTAITWQGGSAPTGNANKQDAVGFSIMQTGASTYIAYGQLVSFG